MTNTTKTTEISIRELVQVFKGKYVNISSVDHYGIAIEMTRGTIEYVNDLKAELWLVSRDSENNVTGSVIIDVDAIESIKEDDGTYTISFNIAIIEIADVEISEYSV